VVTIWNDAAASTVLLTPSFLLDATPPTCGSGTTSCTATMTVKYPPYAFAQDTFPTSVADTTLTVTVLALVDDVSISVRACPFRGSLSVMGPGLSS
jgi:hypothetical protein